MRTRRRLRSSFDELAESGLMKSAKSEFGRNFEDFERVDLEVAERVVLRLERRLELRGLFALDLAAAEILCDGTLSASLGRILEGCNI